jgi:hypothetical protein
MNSRAGKAVLLSLLLLTLAAGYLAFRYFYGISGDFPFSQELLLVFIGAIATVLITALLLNQQTELELRKEGQVLLLDQKAAVYTAVIEHVGEIVEKGRLDKAELYELRVLNHRLAMIASAGVISQFREVLSRLDEAVDDSNMEQAEKDNIMRAVAVLTYHMRRDLLGRIAGEDEAAVLEDIVANNADLEGV